MLVVVIHSNEVNALSIYRIDATQFVKGSVEMTQIHKYIYPGIIKFVHKLPILVKCVRYIDNETLSN